MRTVGENVVSLNALYNLGKEEVCMQVMDYIINCKMLHMNVIVTLI